MGIQWSISCLSQQSYCSTRSTDVEKIPVNGTWFQLIGNGTTTINNGTNGLQKLDTVVRLAEKHGIFLQLSLTNNWNPLPLIDNTTTGLSISARDVTKGTNNSLTRNILSNDYGQHFINYFAFELKGLYRRNGCLRPSAH